ncbi:M48 family metalloprotease [Halogranum rubrum]|uniref:Peptidase M48 domain-containing protein n=1 Tax=Halogranum salarium B-1 TaxID=1210908 RepID=J3JGC7_9EURY|nr:M48 family metalloprotease [Halogranum salarium]EJN60014.1 hypothetical protein HSB1_21720 [Halogranum salarium B-1]
MSKDTALTLRMLGTLTLVLGANLLCVLAFAFLLRPWVSPVTTALTTSLPGALATLTEWTLLVVPLLVAFLWLQLRYARSELLDDVDALDVTRETHPEFVTRLTRLSSQMDVSRPTPAVVDSSIPNSFTVGSPRRATVVVSTGLLDTLDGDELDAVLAHELAHVQNRDAAVMTLASFLPTLTNGDYDVFERLDERLGGASMLAFGAIAVVGYVLSLPHLPGTPLSVTSLVSFVLMLALTVLLGGVALGLLASPVVFLSRRLSRRRELVADYAGAQATGNPTAMVSALQRLEGTESTPTSDLRATETVRDLCFLPHGFEAGGETEFRVSARSHPSTAERIENLRELTASV